MFDYIVLLFLCGLVVYGATRRTLYPAPPKLTDANNPDRDAKLRSGGIF